jgi:hypothetical protein
MKNRIRIREKENTADNGRFAKARISCFYYSEIIDPSSVLLMKFGAGNTRLRKVANRYQI